jgi:hypothetical protein
MIQLTLAYRAQTAAAARSSAIAGSIRPRERFSRQARGGERQRGVDQAPQGVQRMSHLQVIGLGATGWPEDDLAEDLRDRKEPLEPSEELGLPGEAASVSRGSSGLTAMTSW